MLVLNSGSSSIKFSIYAVPSDGGDPQRLLDGQLSGIGTPDAALEIGGLVETAEATDPAQAIAHVLDYLVRPGTPPFEAVGYRVVHPGPKLDRHQRITDAVLAALEAATAFAPLHDPEAVALIRHTMARFPALSHFACFDTVFHQTMPEAATTYPIPLSFRQQGVRRYGFHGLSCESVVMQLRKVPGLVFPRRLIIAHLGSGCSVTALVDGQSVDTSMGLTPTGGVVMGTRPGDLDPGLLFYLLRQPGATLESVEQMLNHESGLKALGGSGDLRRLRASNDPPATLALDIFVTSVRRTIGGMIAVHGIDALVFTGGIGEHDPLTRAALGSGYATSTGLPEVDAAANQAQGKGLRRISRDDARYGIFVVPAEEDLTIAMHVARLSASDQM